MVDEASVAQFWDDAQIREEKLILSGSSYTDTLYSLRIEGYDTPGKHVLEIGPGFGYVVKGFYELGLVVSALDISKNALEKVKSYCEYLFTVDMLEKIPSDYFDLIICVNVIQHIPTDILINELNHCIRSLKTDGVFALQFVSTDIVEDAGIAPSLRTIKAGGCYRSPQYLKKLINNAGGECEMVVDDACNIGDVKGCHVFHIRRI